MSSHYRAYHLVRHVRALRVGSIEASYANPPAQRAHQVRLSMKGAPALRGQLGSPCRCGCPDMCTDGHFHLRSSGSMGRGRHSRRGRITTSCLRVRAPLRMMLGAPNRERSANFSFFFLLNSCIFLLNLGAVSRCRRQIGGGAFAGSPRKTNRVFQLRYAQKAHHRASLFVLHVVRRFSWDPAFCRFFYGVAMSHVAHV